MIPIHHILRCHALFSRPQSNRHPMLIASANEQHLFTTQTLNPRVNVGWNIYTGQMPNMNGAIGIRKCCGNGNF